MNKSKKENYSDIIVHAILSKIISISISDSLEKRIDNKVSNICFQFVKELLDNIASTFCIFYDKDEPRLKEDNNKK